MEVVSIGDFSTCSSYSSFSFQIPSNMKMNENWCEFGSFPPYFRFLGGEMKSNGSIG